MTIEQALRKFVVDNFYVSDPAEIRDETPLVTGGTIDSTGILEVIAFLEHSYGICVADHEMTPDNLDSIAQMSEFVRRKQAMGKTAE